MITGRAPIRRLGLTGSMGAGKSTATAMLATLGWTTFSADAEVARLLAPGGGAVEPIRERWGAEVLSGQGGVDRRKLAERVFGAPAELAWLEGLLHPQVMAACEAVLATAGGEVRVVAEIPLLFEKNLESFFEATVTVSSDPATRRARLRAKGFSESDIEARNAKQLPDLTKMQRADFVLTNAGSLDFLMRQVQRLATHTG